MKSRLSAVTLLMISLVVTIASAEGRQIGDFQIDAGNSLIPVDEIHSGGPPKDGIPSIDRPRFINADDPDAPRPEARILGLSRNGQARAYPISIMNWHEIVNDRLAGESVVITYCPLCGSGMAFSAELGGETLEFGVSGLLYNSDVLLYDRASGSLWSQLMAQAVTGPRRGTRLQILPLLHTTWREWQQLHPDSLVLSENTGHYRNYDRDPYAGYERSDGIYFPVSRVDPRYHPKEQVHGLELDGQFKAYPVAELSKGGERFDDRIGERLLSFRYNPSSQSLRAFDQSGREWPLVRSYWFAWYAFHPETEVYRGTSSNR